jgi:hypothetical protein
VPVLHESRQSPLTLYISIMILKWVRGIETRQGGIIGSCQSGSESTHSTDGWNFVIGLLGMQGLWFVKWAG